MSGAYQALEVWGSQHRPCCLSRSREVPEHGLAYWHGQGRARLWKSVTYVARACFSCTSQVFISNARTGWSVRASGSLGQLWHGRAAQHGLGRARL
ncbi:hypothetical protein JCGZ_14947 [Jatropha curcas]|uniref:Uncharacterized protein n=1 Tax=Jatropha curcas TaxID=180498 RepID=A0A067KK84_JATCU|nr:hypothetical protein JCGZ_14947 [Jatropha curcas]